MINYLLSVLVADYGIYRWPHLYTAIDLGFVSPFTTSQVDREFRELLSEAPGSIEGFSSTFCSLPLSPTVPLGWNDTSFLLWAGGNEMYVTKKNSRQKVTKLMCIKRRKVSYLVARTHISTYYYEAQGMPPTVFHFAPVNFVTAFAPVFTRILAAHSLAKEEDRAVPIGRWLCGEFQEKAGGTVF